MGMQAEDEKLLMHHGPLLKQVFPSGDKALLPFENAHLPGAQLQMYLAPLGAVCKVFFHG